MTPSHSRSGPDEAQNELDFTGSGKGGRRGAVPAAAVDPDALANNPAIASTDASNAASSLSATATFEPGELRGLRDKSEGTLVPGVPKLAATGAAARSGLQGANVVGVIEWPSGAITRIDAQLNIGRDRRFCPFAAEMASELHVSRQHAVLEMRPEGICVRDLGSRNGTFVNDERVPGGGAVFVDKDARIRFGPFITVQLMVLRSDSLVTSPAGTTK